MARIVGGNDHTLTFIDHLNDGAKIPLDYRMPTTKERQKYSNMSYKRKGKNLERNLHAARLWGGKTILTGIREGDWKRMVDSQAKDFTHNPNSNLYAENWKDLVEECGADILMYLGAHVFEGAVELEPGSGSDDSSEESAEESDQD